MTVDEGNVEGAVLTVWCDRDMDGDFNILGKETLLCTEFLAKLGSEVVCVMREGEITDEGREITCGRVLRLLIVGECASWQATAPIATQPGMYKPKTDSTRPWGLLLLQAFEQSTLQYKQRQTLSSV